jgi:hypothetical protein
VASFFFQLTDRNTLQTIGVKCIRKVLELGNALENFSISPRDGQDTASSDFHKVDQVAHVVHSFIDFIQQLRLVPELEQQG